MILEQKLPYERCIHCGQLQKLDTKFCGSCGKPFVVSNTEKTDRSVKYIIAFYIAFLVMAILFEFLRSEDDSFATEITVEAIFALMTVGFAFLDWKRIIPKYRLPKINTVGLILTFCVPVLTGFTVYFAINWLNLVLFDQIDNMYASYAAYNNSLFWAVLFVAITPPIFEELAFRGFLFGQLENVTSARVTIIATAFIFALVHFSFLSFLWIFPFGIFLGYLRHRYKTLWLGMIAHGIHNGIVILMDYLTYGDLF